MGGDIPRPFLFGEHPVKIYSKPGACSMAIHIALRWIGRPFDLQVMDPVSLKAPEYLQLNPEGTVPVLEVDGWVLTQNAAILNYLADSCPESRLGGDGTPKGRAEINRWLAFLNAEVHVAFRPIFGATRYLGDEAMIEKTRAHARTRLRMMFERLDTQLRNKDWLAGARSIADPYLFVTLRWAKESQVDMAGLDDLQLFFQRMLADPDVAAAMAAEGL